MQKFALPFPVQCHVDRGILHLVEGSCYRTGVCCVFDIENLELVHVLCYHPCSCTASLLPAQAVRSPQPAAPGFHQELQGWCCQDNTVETLVIAHLADSTAGLPEHNKGGELLDILQFVCRLYDGSGVPSLQQLAPLPPSLYASRIGDHVSCHS